jgi:hypothetical protein
MSVRVTLGSYYSPGNDEGQHVDQPALNNHYEIVLRCARLFFRRSQVLILVQVP